MSKIEYETSYERILRLDNKRIGQMYPIIFRGRKDGCHDIVENILGLITDHTTKQKEIECYRTLLYNLVYSYCYKGYEGIVFSSNKNNFKSYYVLNGTKHKTKIYYDGSRRFLDKMKNLGYLTSAPGGSLGVHGYKPGYILFTDKFKREVGEYDLVEILPEKNLVRMRNRKTGEYMIFKETDEVIEMIKLTREYNQMMEQWNVELNGVPINSDIYRLFLDSMDYYARWHGEFQIIPSEQRQDITFDLNPTQEIDFQASHITIMYAMKGLQITDSDPYDPQKVMANIDLDEVDFNGCSLTRKDLKTFVMMMINCKSHTSAIKALANEESLSYKYGKGHTFYSSILLALEMIHHEISDLFYVPGFSMTLMKQESEVMAEILRKCVENELPVLPIHDSVVCMEEHVREVNQIMLDSFFEKWHVHCKTKIK
ncbi:TPA: hypothetical protein MA058_003426 [Klebsiella pneumoniae]|nr:hypothetical protein [Klebsiella pneumoniae]